MTQFVSIDLERGLRRKRLGIAYDRDGADRQRARNLHGLRRLATKDALGRLAPYGVDRLHLAALIPHDIEILRDEERE